jgi:hypothetical protein
LNTRWNAAPERLGMTPTAYRRGGEGAAIRFAVGACSLGHVPVRRPRRPPGRAVGPRRHPGDLLEHPMEMVGAQASRFYDAAPERLGMTPTAYRRGGEGAAIRFAVGACFLLPQPVRRPRRPPGRAVGPRRHPGDLLEHPMEMVGGRRGRRTGCGRRTRP